MFLLAPSTTPLPGVSTGALARTLSDLARDAGNIPGKTAMHIPTDLLNAYLGWVDTAERQLSHMLPQREVQAHLLTRRHWALRSMDGGSAGLTSAVRLELEQRKSALEAVRQDLASFHERWESRSGIIAVPDTNLFLDQARPIDASPWSDIIGSNDDVYVVIPLLVIDELDKLKRHNNKKLQRAARHSLRWLQSMTEGDGARSTATTADVEILADPPRHQRIEDADYEILDRAALLERLTSLRVCVVTRDLGMRVRASAVGIETATAPGDAEDQ